MSRLEVSTWLHERGHDTANLRLGAGLVLTVDARDKYAAVERAGDIIERLSARVTLGTRGQLRIVSRAWVDGEKDSVQLRIPRRVDVGALARQGKLYVVPGGSESSVDRALELASPLEFAAPAPAVAGGWAAIESLLAPPGDSKWVAAGRLATLVACSFPRAELTTLAWAYQESAGDDLANRLSGCRNNADRAQMFAGAVAAGKVAPVLSSRSDEAAIARMTELLTSPREVLATVQRYVAESLDAFYRQRNLILHGGGTYTAALRPTLYTAAPLVGAGIDRIAHAWFADETTAIDLYARAENRMALLGTTAGSSPLELLD